MATHEQPALPGPPSRRGRRLTERLITLGFIVIILLMLGLGSFTVFSMRSMARDIERLHRHPLAVTNAAREVSIGIVSIHRSMKDVVLATSQEELQAAIDSVHEHEARTLERFAILNERFLGDVQSIRELMRKFIAWRTTRERVIELARHGRRDEAARITKGEGAAIVSQLSAAAEDLVQFASGKAAAFLARAEEQRNTASLVIAATLVALVTVSVLIAFASSRRLRTYNEQVNRYLQLVEELSLTDELTGLHNRRQFDAVGQRETRLARRHGHSLTLAIVDIDHFKRFNDTYGHQRGDDTLRAVAQALAARMRRPSDYAFRIGGEEFALLFAATSADKTRTFLNSLRREVRSLAIPHRGNPPRHIVTVTIGAAVALPGQEFDLETLYSVADEALYRGKETRNIVIVDAVERGDASPDYGEAADPD